MRIKDGSTRSFNNGYTAKSTPRKRPRPIVRRWMKTHLKVRKMSAAISSKRPIKPFSAIRVGTSRARGRSSKAFSLGPALSSRARTGRECSEQRLRPSGFSAGDAAGAVEKIRF